MYRLIKVYSRLCLFISLVASPFYAALSEPLQMSEAVQLALQRDLVTQQLTKRNLSAREQAVAVASLPNPQLKIGLQNLPTDTFDLDQEPMTQWRLGIAQQFPAGDTLELKSDAAHVSGEIFVEQGRDRALMTRKEVRLLWLEALYWRNALRIYKEDDSFFQQLLRITNSLYSVGRKNQQDLIRAELEIQRLEEKRIVAAGKLAEVRQKLARWIGPQDSERSLPKTFPKRLQEDLSLTGLADIEIETLSAVLAKHPLVSIAEQKVDLQETKVGLAKQNYKPRWGAEVAYGHRDGNNPDGSSRADFFSAMVSVELPIFTASRQDKTLSAEKYRASALRDYRNDVLRHLTADLNVLNAHRQQLESRRLLYEGQILQLADQQAKATLSAYESDATDFAELMRAYLNDQSTKLRYQRLLTDEQQVMAKIHYMLVNDVVRVEESRHE